MWLWVEPPTSLGALKGSTKIIELEKVILELNWD